MKKYTLIRKNDLIYGAKTCKVHPLDVYDDLKTLFLKDCDIEEAIDCSDRFCLMEGSYEETYIFTIDQEISIDEHLSQFKKLLILK